MLKRADIVTGRPCLRQVACGIGKGLTPRRPSRSRLTPGVKENRMAENPCIICVAITGSLPRKANNPAVPITVAEQVESTQEAFEAGATIAHLHVRNEDGTTSPDPERFARLQEG